MVMCYLFVFMEAHIWVWKISCLFVSFWFLALSFCLLTVSKAQSLSRPWKPHFRSPNKLLVFSSYNLLSEPSKPLWFLKFASFYFLLFTLHQRKLLKSQALLVSNQTSQSSFSPQTPYSFLKNQTHVTKSSIAPQLWSKIETYLRPQKMQDPTTFQPMKPQFPEQEQLKCPRCDSPNTKFCYYNNYNLSQPRHFCKNCRRYWTKGGSLRNIPVGGGSRKNTKRSSSSASKRASSTSSSSVSSSSAATAAAQNPDPQPDRTRVYGPKIDQDRGVLDISGSFSSLLTSNGQFGSLLEGLNPNGSGLKLMQMGDFGVNLDSGNGLNSDPGVNPGLEAQSNGNPESYMGLQNGDSSSCWNGGNGWPDLAIYTPGSSFQ